MQIRLGMLAESRTLKISKQVETTTHAAPKYRREDTLSLAMKRPSPTSASASFCTKPRNESM